MNPLWNMVEGQIFKIRKYDIDFFIYHHAQTEYLELARVKKFRIEVTVFSRVDQENISS